MWFSLQPDLLGRPYHTAALRESAEGDRIPQVGLRRGAMLPFGPRLPGKQVNGARRGRVRDAIPARAVGSAESHGGRGQESHTDDDSEMRLVFMPAYSCAR